MIKKNIKKRYWAMILYPESAPQNWRDILIESGLQCAISPLHDKDINPDNTPKKAHYHIILCYENPTTYNNVCNLTESLNQPIPQPLEQLRGYYRYLVHKDNPEKYQYDETLITTINGFDVCNYLDLTNNQINAILNEIVNLIRDNDITEFSDLVDLIKDNETFQDFFNIVVNKHNFLSLYIKSYKYKKQEKC